MKWWGARHDNEVAPLGLLLTMDWDRLSFCCLAIRTTMCLLRKRSDSQDLQKILVGKNIQQKFAWIKFCCHT